MENYFTFSGSWKLPLIKPTSDAALNTCGSGVLIILSFAMAINHLEEV